TMLGARLDSLPVTGFTVNGTTLPRDAVITSLGADWRFAHGWSARARLSGEFSRSSPSHGARGTVSCSRRSSRPCQGDRSHRD
ncbi:hypothetical protein, partial [Stenotrophomonas maltophilia]|uniref:hypothetical protein n=1 Tax=Stenotrophomonas maltophilia TaxID=40324 RepID=UPI001954CCD9